MLIIKSKCTMMITYVNISCHNINISYDSCNISYKKHKYFIMITYVIIKM